MLAGPVFLVSYALSFWAVAGFIPPPAPSRDALAVADLFYAHRSQIRIGMILGMMAASLLFPFFGIISIQIARIERQQPILAVMQFGAATLLVVLFMICNMLWITATFRHDLDPHVIRMLNDLSWLIFIMVVPGYVMQLFCIAAASFMDKHDNPIWPRWAGYMSIWLALTACGGAACVFFKNGPLAWNGAIGFYVPVASFAVWIAAIAWVTYRGIARHYDLWRAEAHVVPTMAPSIAAFR